jgi:ubiquitin C-terminal hydrolase
MHFGSLNSGHYSCICRSRKNRKWVYYNDHFVSEPSDENFVIQENAYMLIYEKVDEHNSFL